MNIILLLSQRYAEELGIHRANKRQPKRTEQSSKQELTYINTKYHIFHLMYVNAQENNEFKGLKDFKKSKNKRRIDILTAKKRRVCEKKYTFAPYIYIILKKLRELNI